MIGRYFYKQQQRGRLMALGAAAVALLLALGTIGASGGAVAVGMGGVSADTTEEQAGEVMARFIGMGEASYYGRAFAGEFTASGEPFDPAVLTAAHRTLPFGTRVRVTNVHNDRSVVVRINDRGPFVAGRIIDVSRAAAEALDMIRRGTVRVRLAVLGSGAESRARKGAGQIGW